jgi:hypothetical protein
MKILVKDIEELRGRGNQTFAVATLDMPYYSFIAFDSHVPRPTPKPHHERLRLRVRLTRPDGSEAESFASIPFIGGQNPPARLTLEELKPEDVPVGTEITLLRYEIEAVAR